LTVTWFADANQLSSTLAVAASETRQRLERAISRLPATAWVFLGQTPWQPASAVVKHKRIWKSLSGEYDLSQFRTQEEICIESELGIRYTAIAYVALGGLTDAISLCRSYRFACMLLAPPSGALPLTTEQIFSAAFPGKPAQVSVDWPSLAYGVCSKGCIVLRETVEAAEGVVTVDFFIAEKQLETFQRIVEK
jgi:hypothetical protein